MKFVFSEDVEVTDISGSTAEIGVYGPKAATVLAAALSRVATPDEPSPSQDLLASMATYGNSRWSFGGFSLFVLGSDEAGVAGFDVVLPAERKAELQVLLEDSGAAAVGAAALETTRIEAGRPRFHVDMDEETIPLEAGIEDRAISLTKGCYVGQEIVIRVLHRGHGRVARRLVGLGLDASAPVPARGDTLRAGPSTGSGRGERDIGSITSAVYSPRMARPIALGYVHRDFVEPGTSVRVLHDGTDYPAIVASRPFAG